MISIDTETTGIDLHHGARPFLVTTCRPGEEPVYWEWPVDPLTREVQVPEGDLAELSALLVNEPELVLHNAKFDVHALAAVNPWCKRYWPWGSTDDTLVAAHVLASNRPKDLTSLATVWLGVDIQPLEDELEGAVKACRRLVKSKQFVADHGQWRVAAAGAEGMPSLKSSSQRDEEKPWKNDCWLPRAVANALGYTADHPWWTACSTYANGDSKVTVELWAVLRAELERRGRWEMYAAQRELLRVTWGMERQGLTGSRGRTAALTEEFTTNRAAAARTLVGIAKKRGHDLVLPKNGANDSIRTFCFDVLKLEPVRNPKAKTDAPSLDAKVAIPYYLATLPEGAERRWLETLLEWRAYGTALGYIESYEKFWLPTEDGDVMVLRPSINLTGTDTLRMSVNNPNSQQISKKELVNLRRCFGPGPGREWWSLDYKNVELRIPAYASKEVSLIELFERPDDPPYYGSQHILNFSVVYPDLWADAIKEVGLSQAGPYCKKKYASTYYQWCKNGDFAIQYNCGRATADAAFHRRGCFDALKSRFNALEALNQGTIRFAEKHGYVETLPDRTVNPSRGYPLLCTRTEHGRILTTVPLSYVVQGTAMWVARRAIVRCQEAIDGWSRKNYDARIVIQQHDEMVFDLPRRADPRTNPKASNLSRVRELARIMERCGADLVPSIPTPVGVEYHAVSWGEGVAV